MTKSTILIIDDEPDYLEILKSLLHQEGFENVITEENPLRVQNILENEKVDLIISDVYMPQMDGIELLEFISSNYPKLPVIMVTAVDDVAIALRAIKLGAYEFITKPPDTDRLFITIRRALENRMLTAERDTLREIDINKDLKRDDFKDIITNSPLMFKVFDLVQIFAPTSETVLIVGETGTGKDLVAKKIHDLSPRQDKPFIAVNLASLSSSLFESELFGHEKGSFTGAGISKSGYFEAANGGTVFLDEIGELPKELQGKLLRVIQYGEIYRIGSPRPVKLDIRIIAATNKNLIEAVNSREFRADLYYRLNRGYIQLPPLKMRGGDIKLLAEYFLKTGSKMYNKNFAGFTKDIMDALQAYSFPGNVRELENIILNAVAKTENDKPISTIELPKPFNQEEITPHVPLTGNNLSSLQEAEIQHIKFILNEMGGNTTKAAAILGISERTLQRRLQKMKRQK